MACFALSNNLFFLLFLQPHRPGQKLLTLVTHLRVELTQFVTKIEELPLVSVSLVYKVTPMLNVNQSAPSTKSVPPTSPVFKTSVAIPVLEFVVFMPLVRLTTTTPSANVTQDILETLSMHVTEKLHVRSH